MSARAALARALWRLRDLNGEVMFGSVGDAHRGVDQWAQDMFDQLALCWRLERAHWQNKLPGGAGHERNRRVLAGADRLIAIRAPGRPTAGTKDAIEQAFRYGIKVNIWHEGRWLR